MPDLRNREASSSSSSSSSVQNTATTAETDQQDLVGNQAIVDEVKANNTYQGQREANAGKTGIVHIGMNGYAQDEARALNRANRGNGGAVSIRNAREQDKIKYNGVDYDLTDIAQCARYVTQLGLPSQVAVDAAQVLADGGHEARDELAQIIRVFSEAELGERSMERVVLSGHSIGYMIWGDDNGEIGFKEFIELSKIFPNAAAQVKHVMLSACYSGGESKMTQYFEMFPNLETIMAYHGSSPGTWSGAIPQMESWESHTESGKDPGDLDPSIAAGTRKAENVSTWNVKDGYQGEQPMDIGELARNVTSNLDTFERFFNGVEEVSNPQSGPLRELYGQIQRFLSHGESANHSMFDDLSEKRDVSIRLLYWQVVNDKFAANYGTQLSSGYEEIGEEVPDFANMTRAEAIAAIDEFEAKASGAAGGASSTALDLLRKGLINLDVSVIPNTWV